MPAFSAAARQHRTAVLRLHALAETVRFGPFGFVGLKCSFWHLILIPGPAASLDTLRISSTPQYNTAPVGSGVANRGHTRGRLADEPVVDIGLLSDPAASLKLQLLAMLFAPLLLMEALRILGNLGRAASHHKKACPPRFSRFGARGGSGSGPRLPVSRSPR